jgi:hypothetical protein
MKRFYGDLFQMQLEEFLNVIKKLYQFYASQPHSPSNNQSDAARASSIDNFLMENQNGEQGEASVVGVGSCRPTHPGSILNRDVPMASHQCLQRRQKRPPLLWSGSGKIPVQREKNQNDDLESFLYDTNSHDLNDLDELEKYI